MTEKRLRVSFLSFLAIIVVVVGLAGIARADTVIVASRVIDDGNNVESDIALLDPCAVSIYDTTNFADVEFLALAGGAFTDPNSSQIVVSIYYPDNVKSFVRCYTIYNDGVVAEFDIANEVGYKYNDITAGQWADSIGVVDDETEFAVCGYRPYYGPPAASSVRGFDNDGDNIFDSTSSTAPGEFLAIASGYFDTDPNMKTLTARFVDDANETDIYVHNRNVIDKDSTNLGLAKYVDVAAADLNADGTDEMLVAVDRSFLATPANSYVNLYTTWGGGSWTPTAQITSFSGEIVAIAAGNFDVDDNSEFVIIRVDQFQPDPTGEPTLWLDETEIRVYDDDLSFVTDSTNPVGRFTSITASDLDDDGLDEIIVGYSPDNTSATVRVYDSNAVLVSESSYYTGAFTDLTVLETLELAPPVNCAEVWQKGYELTSDLNEDCKIDFADFAMFAADWLKCNIPGEALCEDTW
jgi:hypothetical protein